MSPSCLALLCALLLAPVSRATTATPVAASDPAAAVPGAALQDVATDEPPATAEPVPLRGDELARAQGISILWDEYHRYLGTIYDRKTEGDQALRQLVLEVLVRSRAASLGLDDPARVAAAAADERDLLLTRGLTAGAEPDTLQAQLTAPAMEPVLELLALQKLVIRAERGLSTRAPVSDEVLSEWSQALWDAADVTPMPLDDPLAARFSLGTLSRVELGRRIDGLLPARERSGVLTELIGIILVHAKAAELGVTYDTAVAAEELADRERYVLERAGDQGLAYDQVLESVEQRTREELVASPAFTAQVVLRQVTATAWDEERAREYWRAQHERYARRFGPDHPWEAVRHSVWREIRQRTYQQLFAGGTIQRRF